MRPVKIELEEKADKPHQDEGIRDHRRPFVEGLGVLVNVPEELPPDQLPDHDRSQHQERDQRQQPGTAQRAQPAAGLLVSEAAATFAASPTRVPASRSMNTTNNGKLSNSAAAAEQGESGPGRRVTADGQEAAEHRAQETTGTDEGEKAARLPRIEDLVGIGPELRDRDGKGHTQPDVVERRQPICGRDRRDRRRAPARAREGESRPGSASAAAPSPPARE